MNNMLARVGTPQKHPHDLSFSPFYPSKLACAAGQFYGLAGSGSLLVITLPDPPGGTVSSPGAGDPQPVVQTFPWSDSLFALTWSERNEYVIVTGAGDGSIQVYDTNNNKGPVSVLKAHAKEVSSVHWCQCRLNSHLFISASWDQSIKLWNGESLQTVSELPKAHDGLIYEVKSSPLVQGLFASCSGDGSVKLWSMNSATQPVTSWPSHQAEVLSVDWCKYDQNTIACSGTDGLVKVWDVRSLREPKMVLVGHRYAVRRVKFSPYHASVLATSSYDLTVKTWDFLRHNHPIDTYNHHTEFVCGLDFSLHTDMQIASGSWDESVAVWNMKQMHP